MSGEDVDWDAGTLQVRRQGQQINAKVVIAAVLGHTRGTVTARYAKVKLPRMRQALETLYEELTKPD